MTKAKNSWERSLWDYTAPAGLDDAERAMDFLRWAADHFPGRHITISHIVRVSLSLPTLPRDDSQRIDEFRSRRLSRVRKLLFERAQRALLYTKGLGYRATTGDDDVARFDYEGKNKRIVASLHAAEKSRSLINPKNLKDKALAARFEALTEVHRRLMSPSILGRLLPPGDEKKDEKKDPEKK